MSNSEYFVISNISQSKPHQYELKNLNTSEYANLLVDLSLGKERHEQVFIQKSENHFVRQVYFDNGFIQDTPYIKGVDSKVLEIKDGYDVNEPLMTNEQQEEELDNTNTVDDNAETKEAFAKLLFAVLSKHDFKTAEALIEAGGDVNAIFDGKSLFSHLATKQDKEALMFLIKHNVDLVSIMKDSQTGINFQHYLDNVETFAKEFKDSFNNLKTSKNPTTQIAEALKIYNKFTESFKKVADAVSDTDNQKKVANEAVNAISSAIKSVTESIKNKKNRPKQ